MGVAPTIVFPGKGIGLKVVSADSGEQVSSLEENGHYEYEVLSAGYELKERDRIIRHSKIDKGNHSGRIEPGNYVGLLKVELKATSSVDVIGCEYIEVSSTKLNYVDEYRFMLEDIADRCADFLLQIDSPVDQQFVPDDEVNEATLAQRLYFLKSLLGGEDFQLAVQRIVTMPNTQWREEFRTVGVRQSRRLGRYEVKQFASAGRRMAVPAGHALRDVMETIPERIDVRDKRDTVDTPENRFVKHALSMFLQTLEDLLEKFPKIGHEKYPGLRAEIDELIDGLEETLSHGVFKQVSRPELLPLNSPVLQRKEGYRQVLRAWMLFELAAKLSWTGGDDVYAGGKRDAAALYEYWVFFKMLDLVSGLFDLDKPSVESLINDKDLVLKLKAGKHLPIDGVYRGAGRPLCVEFSYNRTFSGDQEYPSGGSWSRQMRPDYTLSLWPEQFSRDQAEEQEVITHVHFDAKYKVDSLTKLFGSEGDNLDEEKVEQRAGRYKRADLLKMHAYRDAIRRTAGAYVLYPGSEKQDWSGFHELLPGLGAFPLRPNGSNDGSAALEGFLKEIVNHVCNRATQQEQLTYHKYRIHQKPPTGSIREVRPEIVSGRRSVPPADTSVINGFIRDSAAEMCRERKLFYFHAVDVHGNTVDFDPRVFQADYFIPYTKGRWLGWYAEVESGELLSKVEFMSQLGTDAGLLLTQVRYYYILRLKSIVDFGIDAGEMSRPPSPGSPTHSTWSKLFATA